VSSKPKKKRTLQGLLWRHWALLIVLGLLVDSGMALYQLLQVGFSDGVYLLASLFTNLVLIAVVLSIRYIVIGGLMRGIRQGMEQPPSKDATKTDQVVSSVGRTTGRYAGIAGRALKQGARKAGRATQAGAAMFQDSGKQTKDKKQKSNSAPSECA
jgi:hypothetical protein